MSRFLKLTEWLGVFPLKIDRTSFEMIESQWHSYWSIFNQILFWLVSIVFFLEGAVTAKNFSALFFTIIDRGMLVMSVPVNMLVFWKFRVQLMTAWNRSVKIARMIDPGCCLLPNGFVIFLIFVLGFLDFGAWITAFTQIYDWDLIEGMLIGIGSMYIWFLGMIFAAVYFVQSLTLGAMNKKLKNDLFRPGELKRFRRIYLSVLLNGKKMSSVFDVYLLSIAVNFFAQMVGLYDFATSELNINIPMAGVIITTILHEVFQFWFVVWIAMQPCYAVKKTAVILEGLTCKDETEKLEFEIEAFTMQILQIDVEVNAYGIRMNFGTIGQLVSNVMAYMLILLQFKQNHKI